MKNKAECPDLFTVKQMEKIMLQVGEVTPIDKPKSMTKHRAEIIQSVFIPLVKRVVLLEMDKDGIGPYSRLEIREAIASLETLMRRKTGE